MEPTVDLVPRLADILVGDEVQLSVSGGSGTVQWSSSDPTVATVAFGLVRGMGPGTAAIRAVTGRDTLLATVKVAGVPVIVLSTAAVSFATTRNNDLPAEQTIDVRDGGVPIGDLAAPEITYVSGGSDWLAAELASDATPTTLRLRPVTTDLPQGAHTATVSLGSPLATNSPVLVTVTFEIDLAPVIELGRPDVEFNAQAGGALPASQDVAVTNGGGGTLTGLSVGTIAFGSGGADWLWAAVDPTTAPATLTLDVTSTDLPPGTYTATVPLISQVTGVAPVSLPVTYVLTPAPVPPAIVLSTSTLSFSATEGSAVPAAQQVSISNGGDGTLDGLVVSVLYPEDGLSGWLDTDLSQSVAPATVLIQPLSVPAAGQYNAIVQVFSPVASNSPQNFAITYDVQAPPAIGLTATSAAFEAIGPGVNPPAQSVGVSNAGGGTLAGLTASVAYEVGSATGWLTAVVASTAPSTPNTTPLTLSVTNNSVPPGTHEAAVTLSAPGVAPQTVTVAFTRIATLTGDIQEQIFRRYCTGCHTLTHGRFDGIELGSVDDSYASLVNKPALSGAPGDILVIPGDSANSYLHAIVKGTTANVADRMPPGCDFGDSSCIEPDLVRILGIWIQQGARK